MKVVLENENFLAEIQTRGAELCAFREKKTGTKFIFEGPEEVWKYHAPVLFPHVGRIKDGFMTFRDKKYSLVNNGFSRDMEHSIVEKSKTHAIFSLCESEETLKKFPWKFSLSTFYELKNDGIIFKTTIKNTDNEEISFSLGSHTAFCCPRNTDSRETKNSDYQYEFEKKIPLKKIELSSDARLLPNDDGSVPKISLYGEKNAGIIPISNEGFGNGHFFVAQEQSWCGLRNKIDGSLIKVNTGGAPFLMVWQGGNANGENPNAFNCIEPWFGTPDSENTNHKWEEKFALIRLLPGKEFTSDQSITIER